MKETSFKNSTLFLSFYMHKKNLNVHIYTIELFAIFSRHFSFHFIFQFLTNILWYYSGSVNRIEKKLEIILNLCLSFAYCELWNCAFSALISYLNEIIQITIPFLWMPTEKRQRIDDDGKISSIFQVMTCLLSVKTMHLFPTF